MLSKLLTWTAEAKWLMMSGNVVRSWSKLNLRKPTERSFCPISNE